MGSHTIQHFEGQLGIFITIINLYSVCSCQIFWELYSQKQSHKCTTICLQGGYYSILYHCQRLETKCSSIGKWLNYIEGKTIQWKVAVTRMRGTLSVLIGKQVCSLLLRAKSTLHILHNCVSLRVVECVCILSRLFEFKPLSIQKVTLISPCFL